MKAYLRFLKSNQSIFNQSIQKLIEENRQAIEQVLKQPHFTWENFIEPLSEAGEHLSRAWSPISHLNSVKNSPELRDAYQACLPLLSEYSTWVGQHEGLYNAYLSLKNSPEFATYSVAQKKAIEMHYVILSFQVSVYPKKNKNVMVRLLLAYLN